MTFHSRHSRYYDHDLIGAKNTLAELESVLKSDYFLFQVGPNHENPIDHPTRPKQHSCVVLRPLHAYARLRALMVLGICVSQRAMIQQHTRSTNQIHGKLYDEDQPENFVQLFVKCAREMWLETFCDIHHKIDLQMLSTQLKLDIADAEEVSAATGLLYSHCLFAYIVKRFQLLSRRVVDGGSDCAPRLRRQRPQDRQRGRADRHGEKIPQHVRPRVVE